MYYDDEGIGVIGFIIVLILTIIFGFFMIKERTDCEKQGGIYLYQNWACLNPKDFVKGEK